MPDFRGEVIGLETTLAKANRLLKVTTSRDAQAITMFVAGRIRRQAQIEAPIAKIGFSRLRSKVSVSPGQLRRSIVARGVRQERVTADGPAAFVLPLIYRGAEAKRAPHAHLIALGTRDRRPKGGVFGFPVAGGRVVFTRHARGLKPNDYMARAVALAGPSALDELSRKFDELIVENLKENG
jgi:hypothetical protein